MPFLCNLLVLLEIESDRKGQLICGLCICIYITKKQKIKDFVTCVPRDISIEINASDQSNITWTVSGIYRFL